MCTLGVKPAQTHRCLIQPQVKIGEKYLMDSTTDFGLLSQKRNSNDQHTSADQQSLGRFFLAAGVAATSPRHELGKVAISIMFLKRTKSKRSGASSLGEFHHSPKKSQNMRFGSQCASDERAADSELPTGPMMLKTKLAGWSESHL